MVRSQFCRIMNVLAPDTRSDLTVSGSIRLCDPTSSCPSHSIEVFPELRRRCGAHGLALGTLGSTGTSLPKRNLISIECISFSAFHHGGTLRCKWERNASSENLCWPDYRRVRSLPPRFGTRRVHSDLRVHRACTEKGRWQFGLQSGWIRSLEKAVQAGALVPNLPLGPISYRIIW
jgi:hypothetical protein